MEDQRNTFEELNEESYFTNRLTKDLIDHPELNEGINKAISDFVNKSYTYS